MNLCSKNHDEICFEERYCPICSLLNKLEEINSKEIDILQQRINDLENQIRG